MQQFEAHLTEMERYLVNWASTSFSGLDHATRDEALQRTRITLWERYRKDAAYFNRMPRRQFTQYAKTIYGHSLYDKKERVINRRFVQAGVHWRIQRGTSPTHMLTMHLARFMRNQAPRSTPTSTPASTTTRHPPHPARLRMLIPAHGRG